MCCWDTGRAAASSGTLRGPPSAMESIPYFDLALLDAERGIDILREVLRGGNIHRRSWILFFDDSLAEEWIGIWPDSPEPPMSAGE